MVRITTLGVLLLAIAHVAAADDKAPTMSAATSAPTAESAQATKEPIDAIKQRPKSSLLAAKVTDSKAVTAAASSDAAPPSGDVKMSGISILGNEDAPKSLVLVPWKSSQLADMPSVSRLLDSKTQPVDKDVFMRELSYYQFKSGSSEANGSRERAIEK